MDYDAGAKKLQADLDATGPLIRWCVKREVGRVKSVLVVHAQAYPESSCYFTVPIKCLDGDTVAWLVNAAVKDMMGGA